MTWCRCKACLAHPDMRRKLIADVPRHSFDHVETPRDWVHNQINSFVYATACANAKDHTAPTTCLAVVRGVVPACHRRGGVHSYNRRGRCKTCYRSRARTLSDDLNEQILAKSLEEAGIITRIVPFTKQQE